MKQTIPVVIGEPLLPPTMMIERGGARVGFIGLTADIVPRMAKPFVDDESGGTWTPFSALRRAIEADRRITRTP